MVQIKRVYDKPAVNDGIRVLVDRLWPRGVSKEEAALDLWLKEIAPSPVLRVWFDHKPERFRAFSDKYLKELSSNPVVAELKKLITENPTVTLLYGAKDPAINHAVVLERFLEGKKDSVS